MLHRGSLVALLPLILGECGEVASTRDEGPSAACPGGCLIGSSCIGAGDTNGCLTCDPGRNASDWSQRPEGADCAVPTKPCFEGGKCNAGQCIASPRDCDDGVSCTIDDCDASQGCTNTASHKACDDGIFCNGTEICALAIGCKSGAQPSSDDGIACTVAVCDEALRDVFQVPLDDLCEAEEPCQSGTCHADFGCVPVPQGTACNDGNACTKDDHCDSGMCLGSPKDCDDGEPCTIDWCDAGACLGTPVACDDGDPCTKEACAGGACVSKPISCNDGDPCTTDACDTATGCVHAAYEGPCNDGKKCTIGDSCATGKCTGKPVDCTPANPCLEGYCESSSGSCVFETKPGPCDDGNACSLGETCDGVVCTVVPAEGGTLLDCDDGDPCTNDLCDPTSGCYHTPTCADVDPCTSDLCKADGTCYYGNACDDGDGCTEDTCNEGACSHEPACSAWETCDPVRNACVGVMVPVPEGTFWMGCLPGDTACGESEKPVHEVMLDTYAIDVTEVTNAAFVGFLNAHGNDCFDDEWCGVPKGCDPPLCSGDCGSNHFCLDTSLKVVQASGDGWTWSPGQASHPAVNVTWLGAMAYCAWAGKALCTEAQWEKAARGGCALYPNVDCLAAMPMFPWGDAPASCKLAVMYELTVLSGCGANLPYTWPVGSKPAGASPYGLLDMAGNALEWVFDAFGMDYYASSPAVNPTGPAIDPWGRVLRGGSPINQFGGLRTSYRYFETKGSSSYVYGFRCCGTPGP